MKTVPPIFNFYSEIMSDPGYYRQLSCDDLLITEYTCPLGTRMQALWAQHNYFVYVLEGKKIWRTAWGAHELDKGDCAFVRKGASIVEQFFDTPFCVMMFFVPDEFITETLRSRLTSRAGEPEAAAGGPVFPVGPDVTLSAFFHSMLPYFARMQPPDKSLLELKFRELLLNISDNPRNRGLMDYLSTMLQDPSGVSLRQIMEDNFCYNLSLEEFAQLCNRSLSAFKRDFQKTYGVPPGKWLTGKRLAYARAQLQSPGKTVSEVAYESGFENLSHFSRAFRNRFGIPPTALRQQSNA